MTTEIVPLESIKNESLSVIPSYDLQISRAPEIVLEEARRAARALKDVIEAKEKKVIFNGEQYLEFEDWQTVGRFYGISPRIPETGTRYVEYGGAKGWEAFAEAIDVRTGRVVSSASAMCLDDEEKWSSRPKYVWQYVKKSGGYSTEDPGKDELIWDKVDGKSRPRKERRLTGEEGVPQFQLRSMAQTRAGSKALRNALAWVVVLAGYRPTPAEEMEGGDTPKTQQPARSAVTAPSPAPTSGMDTVEAPTNPDSPELKAESEHLFPTPNADKPALLQRARVAIAKHGAKSPKVLGNKRAMDIDPDAPLDTIEIGTLGAFVRQLEAP